MILSPLKHIGCASFTAGAALACWLALGAPPAMTQVSGVKDVELPEGKGREEVEAYCSACHSLRIVVQQGLTRTAWDELLDWMVEEQGMPELEDDERTLVLDYLAEHVGPDSNKQ